MPIQSTEASIPMLKTDYFSNFNYFSVFHRRTTKFRVHLVCMHIKNHVYWKNFRYPKNAKTQTFCKWKSSTFGTVSQPYIVFEVCNWYWALSWGWPCFNPPIWYVITVYGPVLLQNFPWTERASVRGRREVCKTTVKCARPPTSVRGPHEVCKAAV